MKVPRVLCAVLVLAPIAAGCASSAPDLGARLVQAEDLEPVSLANGERLEVVATTGIVGEVVSAIGGASIHLTVLLPAGADPHTFEPSAQDLRALADAHVVFLNGLGLEEALSRTLAEASSRAGLVSLSEGIEPLELAPGDGAPAVDPHVWLDPTRVVVWAGNAARALAALDPARAEEFRAQAGRYQQSLVELDAWIADQVALIPPENRLLVTDHDELGYFAVRYGFRVVGTVIPGYSTAAEPSAQELAELEDAIAALGVRAVFVAASVNPQIAEQVARDTGVSLVALYTHTLGPAGGPADSYLELMHYNVRAIVEALR